MDLSETKINCDPAHRDNTILMEKRPVRARPKKCQLSSLHCNLWCTPKVMSTAAMRNWPSFDATGANGTRLSHSDSMVARTKSS